MSANDDDLMTPDRVNTFSQRIALRMLQWGGWRLRYRDLPAARGIIVVYPHTSNWDFFVGVLAKWALGLQLHFIAKSSLFEGLTGATIGRFLRYLGGEPVRRDTSAGVTHRLAATIQAADHYWLAITPEGTRSYRPYWRSGFYHIALAANLPVGCAYFDFARKEIALVDYVNMTGDQDKDMAQLRAIFAGHDGKHPALAAPIVLRPEASDGQSSATLEK